MRPLDLPGHQRGHILEGLDKILSHYPDRRSALIPILNRAQELYGWLSPDVMEHVAHSLGLTTSHVRGVATFHVLYHTQQPGRHIVQLCTNIACMLFGAEGLLDVLDRKFDLRPGMTSGDGRFSLIIMECIGACDKAPAMVVDSDLHQIKDKEHLIGIMERYM